MRARRGGEFWDGLHRWCVGPNKTRWWLPVRTIHSPLEHDGEVVRGGRWQAGSTSKRDFRRRHTASTMEAGPNADLANRDMAFFGIHTNAARSDRSAYDGSRRVDTNAFPDLHLSGREPALGLVIAAIRCERSAAPNSWSAMPCEEEREHPKCSAHRGHAGPDLSRTELEARG